MTTLDKLKVLSFAILFEAFGLSQLVFGLTKYSPPNALWPIILIIKFGIGYIVYRLYISRKNGLRLFGRFLVLAFIIAAYAFYYINPTAYSYVGGHNPILLSASTLFLIRYLRHPDILQSFNDRLIIYYGSRPFNQVALVVMFVIIVWAIVDIYTGIGNFFRQSMTFLLWIPYYAWVEGNPISNNRNPSETLQKLT